MKKEFERNHKNDGKSMEHIEMECSMVSLYTAYITEAISQRDEKVRTIGASSKAGSRSNEQNPSIYHLIHNEVELSGVWIPNSIFL